MTRRAAPVAAMAGAGRGGAALAPSPNAFYELCVLDAHGAPVDRARPHALPFMRTAYGARAWRSPYTFLTTPRLMGREADAGWDALLDPDATPRGLLRFELLPGDRDSWRPFAEAARAHGLALAVVRRLTRPALDAAQSLESWHDALSRQRRKALRKARRTLEERGAVTHARHRRGYEVGEAFATFVALEASGWKGRSGTALAQHARDRAAFGAALQGLARAGACEIHTLHLDGAPIAAGIALLDPPHAFYAKIAYDEAHARHSPGVLLSTHVTASLIDNPRITLGDSCATEGNDMIAWLWPGRREIVDVVVASRPGVPQGMVDAAASGLRRAHRAREWAKSLRDAYRAS